MDRSDPSVEIRAVVDTDYHSCLSRAIEGTLELSATIQRSFDERRFSAPTQPVRSSPSERNRIFRIVSGSLGTGVQYMGRPHQFGGGRRWARCVTKWSVVNSPWNKPYSDGGQARLRCEGSNASHSRARGRSEVDQSKILSSERISRTKEMYFVELKLNQLSQLPNLPLRPYLTEATRSGLFCLLQSPFTKQRITLFRVFVRKIEVRSGQGTNRSRVLTCEGSDFNQRLQLGVIERSR